MKSQSQEILQPKTQTRRKVAPKIVPFVGILILFAIVSISYPSIRYSQRIISGETSSSSSSTSSDNDDDITIRTSSDDVTWWVESSDQPCPIEDVATQPCNPSGGGGSQTPPSASAAAADSVDVGDHDDRENTSSTPGESFTVTAELEEEVRRLESEGDRENIPAATATSVPVKLNLATREEKTFKVPTRKKPSRRSRRRSGRRQRRDSSLTAPRIIRKMGYKYSPARDGVDDDVKVLASEVVDNNERCDLFSGEWIPNPEGPYYTNMTCNWAIQEHQNCMKFGRPDTGFLKWRWKPDGCELPVFYPTQFLEFVRGKSLAFVGDSVARNHMQSLLCLLSRVAYPFDASNTADQNFKRYEYRDYDFNVSIFWSPYLVRTEKTDPDDVTRPFKLFLDEIDESWTTKIENFDYVIVSAGHWFFRPTYFYLNGNLVGCQYCPQTNVSHLPAYFSYRWAFRTAFRAITALDDFAGVVFLRTFAPSHFEGAPWDKGGDCVRRRPLRRSEKVLDDYNLEFYKIQLQELKTAQNVGRKKGMKIRLFDATLPMLLRPDGHPSKFGRWLSPNVTVPNDCVHWCLPGPIDSWNDFLLELMRREGGDRKFEI